MYFELSDKELEQANAFIEKHSHRRKGKFEYLFSPTGIGNGVTISCTHCKKKKDITDYSSW